MKNSIAVECSSVSMQGDETGSVWATLKGFRLNDIVLCIGREKLVEAIAYWDEQLEKSLYPVLHPWNRLKPEDTIQVKIT